MFIPQKKDDGINDLCMPQREDYFECLHHRKEHDHVRKVMEQEKLNQQGVIGDGHH